MINFPLRASLRLLPGEPRFGEPDTFIATVYDATPTGITWQSQHWHPQTRIFTPWHRVVDMTWEQPE